MKRLFSTMIVTAILFTLMSMTVFASYVPSQGDQYLPEATTAEPGELPGDEFYNEDDENDKDDNDKSKAPKTGDERVMIYTAVMAMIAASGTVVIAKRKED